MKVFELSFTHGLFFHVKDNPELLLKEIRMEKEEEKEEEIEVIISCKCPVGVKLTEDEIKDVENLFNCIMNDETYLDDSDAWVMEMLLFMLIK